ncbi:MAG: hypothetical protein B7Z02_16255 [Rhodobacterales bacterium 32-67-9]|nr:MAG: hypothetical protein B7Z02_16255 [Rhodobacterales bacterium 32-67-9]
MLKFHDRWIAPPLVLALSLGTAWGQTLPDADRYGYGPGMMGWGGGYGMFFGPLFMILILAVVVAAVVIVLQGRGGSWLGGSPPHGMPPGRTPIDILKERFAKGEIDKAEFEERRHVLGE